MNRQEGVKKKLKDWATSMFPNVLIDDEKINEFVKATTEVKYFTGQIPVYVTSSDLILYTHDLGYIPSVTLVCPHINADIKIATLTTTQISVWNNGSTTGTVHLYLH
jgi:hypothetical protein